MELDAEKLLENAIRDAVRDRVKTNFTGYNSALDKLIESAIGTHSGSFRSMLETSISACINDEQFRSDIAQQVRHQLAKTLVQRFGGELEKQVNVLKSDPATRARITLAIEEIVKADPQR